MLIPENTKYIVHATKSLLVIFTISFSILFASARAEESKEYIVKAAFIYNFTKFVEWPGEKAIAANNSINICLVGGNPFGAAISVFQKASNEKLKLNVVSRNSSELSDCHIAYFSSGYAAGAPSNVLTVGETPGFANNGGVVGFTLVEGKVKIEVNKSAAVAADLKVNAQLLEIAVRVIQ